MCFADCYVFIPIITKEFQCCFQDRMKAKQGLSAVFFIFHKYNLVKSQDWFTYHSGYP